MRIKKSEKEENGENKENNEEELNEKNKLKKTINKNIIYNIKYNKVSKFGFILNFYIFINE